MDSLDLYTLTSVAVVLTLFVAPLVVLLASYNPVDCAAAALRDLALAVPIARNPVELVQRGGLVVVIARWPDLGPLLNSLLLPLVVASVSTAVGLTYALVVYLYRVPRLMALLPLLAYLPIPFVKVLALQSVLDPDLGLVNRVLRPLGLGVRVEGLAAVALYQTLAFFPFSYSIILSYTSVLPREFTEGAYSLGSPPRVAIARVLVPLLRPAIYTSLALTYVLSLEDLEAPLIFEGYPDVRGLLSYRAYVHFVSEVYSGFSTRAVGYTLIVLAASLAVFAVSARYLVVVYRSFGSALVRPPAVYRSGVGPWVVPVVAVLAVFLALSLLPTLVALASALLDPLTLRVSPSLYLLLDPTRVRSTLNTVAYTTLSILLSLAVALPLAYKSSRGSRAQRVVEVLAVLPLSVPGVAVAYSYIGVFGSLPVNPFNTPWLYLVLSYSLRRLPYVYVALRSTLSSIPRDYEEAAQVAGARPLRAVVTTVVPIALLTSTYSLSLASVTVATEVSTSVTIGGLGATQGWGSVAPLVYTIYRDVTASGTALTGVYSVAVLIAVLTSVATVRLVLTLFTRYLS
jgi:ABC-type Fe3+ transport system permease subunit